MSPTTLRNTVRSTKVICGIIDTEHIKVFRTNFKFALLIFYEDINRGTFIVLQLAKVKVKHYYTVIRNVKLLMLL